MRLVLLATVGFAVVATAAPNPKIAEARRLFEELELEKAAKALAAAEAQPDNDLEQVLEVLELQGLVFGTLGKDTKAFDAFRKLVLLKPDYALGGDQPPRVRTPFYEAREWVAQNKPLEVVPSATASTGGTELSVAVKKDTLRVVKRGRFLVTGREPMEAALSEGALLAVVPEKRCEWRVELLGAKDAVLRRLGPFVHESQATAGPATAATSPPVSATEPVTPPAKTSALRPLGVVLGSVAVAAFGVGLGLGLGSSSDRARVTGASVTPTGLVDGVTQREAAALESRSTTMASTANVLFVSAGVLAASGLVFFLLGAPAETVSLGVGPAGAVVRGVFP